MIAAMVAAPVGARISTDSVNNPDAVWITHVSQEWSEGVAWAGHSALSAAVKPSSKISR